MRVNNKKIKWTYLNIHINLNIHKSPRDQENHNNLNNLNILHKDYYLIGFHHHRDNLNNQDIHNPNNQSIRNLNNHQDTHKLNNHQGTHKLKNHQGTHKYLNNLDIHNNNLNNHNIHKDLTDLAKINHKSVNNNRHLNKHLYTLNKYLYTPNFYLKIHNDQVNDRVDNNYLNNKNRSHNKYQLQVK